MTDSSDIEGTITKSDVLVDYVTAINVVIVTYEISFWYEQMAFQSLTVHGVDCYDDSRPLLSNSTPTCKPNSTSVGLSRS